MPSKKLSALAAGALLFASSTAIAQTAGSAAPAALTSAALAQETTVDEVDEGTNTGRTALVAVAVLAAIAILIWLSDGDGDPDSP